MFKGVVSRLILGFLLYSNILSLTLNISPKEINLSFGHPLKRIEMKGLLNIP